MKNLFQGVLVNPKPRQIAAALAAADAQANPPKAKVRKYHFPADLAKKIRNRKQGVYEDDGGAVANSYQYSADTSHVLAAWWTSGNGTRYVRITGGRVSAAKHSHGGGDGCPHVQGDPWEAVFPKRARNLADAAHARAQLAVLRCGVWPHWTPEDILHLFAAKHGTPSGLGRINDLLGMATFLLPDKLRSERGLRLVATAPRGVIIVSKDSGFLVVRQHDRCLCELLPLPPRFRERKDQAAAELIEAAWNYHCRKDPRLETEYAPPV